MSQLEIDRLKKIPVETAGDKDLHLTTSDDKSSELFGSDDVSKFMGGGFGDDSYKYGVINILFVWSHTFLLTKKPVLQILMNE